MLDFDKLSIGTEVKDKFKSPKEGDESVYGQILALDKNKNSISVVMDTGHFEERKMTLEQFEHLFTIVGGIRC